MKLDSSDIPNLEPLIKATVVAVIDEIRANEATLGDRLAYPEAEAAALLGIARHVLRDARLRGEIVGHTVGRKILYSRASLLKLLSDGPRK
jgi:hypothetical protein